MKKPGGGGGDGDGDGDTPNCLAGIVTFTVAALDGCKDGLRRMGTALPLVAGPGVPALGTWLLRTI